MLNENNWPTEGKNNSNIPKDRKKSNNEIWDDQNTVHGITHWFPANRRYRSFTAWFLSQHILTLWTEEAMATTQLNFNLKSHSASSRWNQFYKLLWQPKSTNSKCAVGRIWVYNFICVEVVQVVYLAPKCLLLGWMVFFKLEWLFWLFSLQLEEIKTLTCFINFIDYPSVRKIHF